MAEAKPRRGSTDRSNDSGEVLVLRFPVPREPESQPPEPDPDETPTMIPEGSEPPPPLRAGIDDRATEPPEEIATEPPPGEEPPLGEDTPTLPPDEPTTLIPPEPPVSTKGRGGGPPQTDL